MFLALPPSVARSLQHKRYMVCFSLICRFAMHMSSLTDFTFSSLKLPVSKMYVFLQAVRLRNEELRR
jgi:hypothetical protein